ncbi:hypothetical protein [Pedobacter sp.]|uniref:hypothetical protein n=1 Tax=Pedobacter sp. TaxID=1411316 RepID=UPI0031DB85C6
MIELKTLDGEKITLNKTDVTIELNSSLFNDGGKFNGSFSYPLSVAFTGPNKLLLGFANAIETSVKSREVQVLASINGKDFKQCTLRVSVSDNSFECNLDIDLGIINNFLSTTYLTDIPFETYSLGKTLSEIQTSMMDAATNLDWRVIPYTFFPVRNYEYSGGASSGPADPVLGTEDNPVGTPDPRAENTTIINAVYPDGDITRFTVQLPDNIPAKHHTVPFFYLPYVLSKICEALNMTITGDFIQHPDIAKTVIYNVNGTFISRASEPGLPTEEKQGMFFKASDHLPKVLISDLFKALSAMCIRITPDIAKGEINFSWKKSVFEKPTYADWTEKPVTIKKMDFEISEGYTVTAEIDKMETDKEQPVDRVVVGAGKTSIDIKAGTLRSVEEPIPGTNLLWTIPWDSHAGNIVDPIFSDLGNFRSADSFVDFPLRFVVSRGVGFWKESTISYPMGSHDGEFLSLKVSGTYITTVTPDEPDVSVLQLQGMDKYAIRPWYDRTFAAKKTTVNVLLDPLDICSLKDSDIILLKGENGVTVEALFEKISFTSGRSDQVMAEADLIILDSAYIVSLDNNGVFVKISEGNPQNGSAHDGRDVMQLPYGAYRIDLNNIYVDLTVSIWSDRACSIPLLNSGISVFVKTVTSENRREFTENRNPTVGEPGTWSEQQQEYFSVRRVLFGVNNIITLPTATKRGYEYWWISAWDGDYDGDLGHEDERMMCSEVWIYRNSIFSIQANSKYTIIK